MYLTKQKKMFVGDILINLLKNKNINKYRLYTRRTVVSLFKLKKLSFFFKLILNYNLVQVVKS